VARNDESLVARRTFNEDTKYLSVFVRANINLFYQ
jgi:hypothetical protein